MATPTEDSNSPKVTDPTSDGDKAISTAEGNDENSGEKGAVANSDTSAESGPAKKTANKAKQPAHHRRGHRNIGAWSAVVLILLVAGGVYTNFQGLQKNQQADLTRDQQQQELLQKLAALRTELEQLRHANEQLQTKANSAELDRQSLTMELEKVAKLAADKGKAPVYWRVAEAEYLLKVANQRVILEQDVRTALTALRDADKRLAAEADPGLIPVRQQITAEINSLSAVQQPDIAGSSVQLSELVSNVQALPLIGFNLDVATADTASAPKASDWQELPKAMWRDILSLVSIRRRDQPIEPMLPPDEQHYLAQNLGLKLEQSRVALLRRDTGVYRRNLIEAREWIQRYFDKESTAVQQVLEQVAQLESAELQPALPDISGSLRSLRAWLASQTQAIRQSDGDRG